MYCGNKLDIDSNVIYNIEHSVKLFANNYDEDDLYFIEEHILRFHIQFIF